MGQTIELMSNIERNEYEEMLKQKARERSKLYYQNNKQSVKERVNNTLSAFAHFCFFEEKSKSVPNVLQYDPYGTQTPWVGQKNSGGFMGVDPIKDSCQVCVNHRQQHAEGAHVAFFSASSITHENRTCMRMRMTSVM